MPTSTTSGAPEPAAPASTHRAVVALVGALAGAVAVAAVTIVTGWGWSGVAASVALVPAAMAAAIDVRTRRLPDLLVALSAATGLFVTVVVRGWSGFVMAVLGAACLTLPLLVAHLVSPAAIGFGDVKLGGALGVSIGVISPDASTALLLAALAVAVASATGLVIAIVTRRRDVALGPALVTGAAVALMSADQLGGVALSWQ